MLHRDPNKRIGSNGDAQEIMEHPFFESVNWDHVMRMEHTMPFKPKIKHAEDTSCIDKLFTREPVQDTLVPENMLNAHQKNQAHFVDFTY